MNIKSAHSSFTSVALIAILSLTFYLRLLFFGQMIDADVGNIAYMGWRMAEGEVLIDLEGPGKPPLYAMFYAFFVWFFGPSVPGLKMFGALFVLMAVIAIYWVAKVAYGEKAGLLAALLFGVFSSGAMVEGGTVNLETVLHFPSILCIGFFLKASTTGRLKWYFWAGLCAAMAALVKQVGGVIFFVFLCSGLHENWKKKEWFFRYGILGAGALAPIIGLLVFYSFHGYGPGELYDSMVGSNFRYLGRALEYRDLFIYFFSSMKFILLETSLLWIGSLFSAFHLLRRMRQGQGERADPILLWWAFWSFGVLWISGTFYAHYFLQIIAPFSILAACGILEAWKLAKSYAPSLRPVARGGLALVLAIAVILFVKTDHKYFLSYNPVEQTVFQFKGLEGIIDQYGYGAFSVLQYEIASHIRNRTDPADTIYVWGVSPQLYYLAQRKAATRYRNNFNISLNVTGNPGEALRAYGPVAMEEIKKSFPAYIIQVFRFEDFPDLQSFVRDHYLLEMTMDLYGTPFKINLYRRKA
jgi:4-amino-4-deoxy-L-arabinose transferase-like glycosyltransferase